MKPRKWLLLWALLLRPSLRRPFLLLASLLGIAAGTAILCALNLANQRALHSFEVGAAGLPGEDGERWVQLRSPRGRIPVADLSPCLNALPRGVRCRGVLSETLQTQQGPVRLLGMDGDFATAAAPLFSSGLLRKAPALTLLDGRVVRPAATLPSPEYLVVLDFPEAWALTAGRDTELAPGYDYIEISTSHAQLLTELERAISVPVRRVTAAQQIESQKALTATYRFNLRVLGGMSILIGALLLRNVAALYCLLKRPALAVLRQLGASRRLLLLLLLTEQALLGLCGGALGLLLGLRLEAAVSERVIQTVSDLYVKTAAARSELPVLGAVLTIVAGMGIFLLAGAQSTWQLASVMPAALSKRVGQAQDTAPLSLRRSLVLLLGALAVIFTAPYVPPVRISWLADAQTPQPLFGYLAAGAVFVVAYALAPHAQQLWARAMTKVFSVRLAPRFPALAIAARRSLRAGTRGRAAVTTLAGGLGLIIGIELMVGGFRHSLDAWISTVFQSDWVGDIRALPGTETRPRILESELHQLQQLPGVRGVDCILLSDGFVVGGAHGSKRAVKIAGVEDALLPDRAAPVEPLQTLDGRTGLQLLQLLSQDPRYALVSEPLASKFHVGPGDSIQVELGAGPAQQFMIAAVTREYSSELGFVYVDRKLLGAALGLDGCHGLRVYGEAGLTSSRRDALLAAMPAHNPALWQKVRLFPNEQVRKGALRTFDQTFAVTAILTVLAALLGGLALLVQVIQSVAERTPEWMSLRRLGTSRWGLLRLCAAEIGLAVLAGLSVGVVSGTLLGWILCFAINKQAFGWSVAFLVPVSVLRALVLTAVFGGALWLMGTGLSALVLRPADRLRVTRE